MGKFFIDTEFVERSHKPLFGKRRHIIDLISIGIVAEDGREYYAISKEFNPRKANIWVRHHVINKLEKDIIRKSNQQIAREITEFCNYQISDVERSDKGHAFNEFYGYFSDYDWVLLASMYGEMAALPACFPFYCKDLKQYLDDYAQSEDFEIVMDLKLHTMSKVISRSPEQDRQIKMDLSKYDLPYRLELLRRTDQFPKEENEHNALADARWNKKLYDFLNR